MMRWPAGMGLAAWRWLRGSRGVARGRLRSSVVAEIERLPERGGDRLQHPRQGAGPAFQRRYTVRITGTPLNAEQLIDRLCEDINAASPVEIAVFDKTSGGARCLDIGDEYDVHMPGPWNCPVRVVERRPRSFRFATLEGHIEAGEIEFRAADAPDGDVVFTIESWARSGSRLADLLYDRLRIAKEMQLHMWTHFCSRVADLAGGRVAGEVEVHTDRAEVAGDSRLHAQHLTRFAAAAVSRMFTTAARLRGGRPLHPDGLVCDAVLLLHGASKPWGVPFLDDTAELRGVARLSRSVGLPPPLPDVLGLALRWRQPATVPPGGEPDTAELLLASTGQGLLGRHLPRPAFRWSPGFYGSLLPYAAGDRRVLLGAVARRPCVVSADAVSLARALGESPLPLDLVIATEFGAWEPFGELLLTGPARGDDGAPMRFDPAGHQVPGLPPAGTLQQIRGPVYAAVHRAAGPRDRVAL
ncbi:DUF1990 family protein [Actinomadura sp. NBRC 104425]|uniref:DUF1990 family protein n=1 Tax=Actinomadura sp. NBRC 104425 TaxID=3032204 RepID=UPI002555E7D3|nr:DUF1990 family protein [Actinomadura sp. NBRC 104425]